MIPEQQQQQQHCRSANVLVIANPDAPELSVLQQLPPGAQVLAVGQTFRDFSHLSDDQWGSIDVICKMGGGSISRFGQLLGAGSSNAVAGGSSSSSWGRSSDRPGGAAAAADKEEEEQENDSEHGDLGVAHHIHRSNSSSVSLTQSLEEFWPHLTNLRWLHTGTVGMEHLLTPELIKSDVIVTNARGVYSHSLAEFAIMMCHFFAKGLPRFLTAKAEKRWDIFEVEELRGKTIGIIGYGDIGRIVARMAQAHEMRVVGLRRHPSRAQQDLQQGLLAELLTPNQLHELMSQSDYVVLATPYTPDTHQLVDAAAIAAMKPNGVLINVGRGKCVDEEALAAALQSGAIKGAGLDVFDVEPLPPSSPLWTLPNVFISPHSTARTDRFMFDNMNTFVDNLRKYLIGQPLTNMVDKHLGY